MMILKRILELQLMILIAVHGESRTGDPEMHALRRMGGRGKCANQTIAFDKKVLITYFGRAEDISTAELCTLQQTFASTYNALTASTCTNRAFRTVEIVTALTDYTATPSAQSSIYPSALSGIRFQIIGHCRGCKKNLNLFTRDTSRRLQAVTDKEQSHHHHNLAKGETSNHKERILQWNNSAVDVNNGGCQSGRRKNRCAQCEPPSYAAFAQLYKAEIQRLRSSGVIQSIDSIEKVTELTAVPCAVDFSEFDSNVLIRFSGYPDDATDNQLAALEQGFLQTYNNLNLMNDETCDVTFKEIVNVEIITDASLQVAQGLLLQTTSSHQQSALQRVPVSFSYNARITGRCRGCPPGDKIGRAHV